MESFFGRLRGAALTQRKTYRMRKTPIGSGLDLRVSLSEQILPELKEQFLASA